MKRDRFRDGRRRILQGVLGAAGLLRAPKRALATGNAACRRNPLRNPANDARGMTGSLEVKGHTPVEAYGYDRA